MNLEMKLTHRKSVTAFLIYAAAGVGWPVGVLGGDGAENGMAVSHYFATALHCYFYFTYIASTMTHIQY